MESTSSMFCKKCSERLVPDVDRVESDDPYYRNACRCQECGYLYYLDYPDTWNVEKWMTDLDHKAKLVLEWEYQSLTGWRRDVYLVLHFLDQLQMVTWYFRSPEFTGHRRLDEVFEKLDANKSRVVLHEIIDLAGRQAHFLEELGLTRPLGEQEDDAWEAASWGFWMQISPRMSMSDTCVHEIARSWRRPERESRLGRGIQARSASE